MIGTSSSRMLEDVLGMLAADGIRAAVGRSVATSARFRKASSVDPLETSAPMGIKVGREVDGDWERHGRKLETADASDGVETHPAHRYHSPGHAHWVTIHGHVVYINDAGLFHLHGKENPGTRPGDANWHEWTDIAEQGSKGSGPGKDGKAGTSEDHGGASDASPALVPVECPTMHGRSQIGRGDELFSLSSTPSGSSDPGDVNGDGDDDRLLAHVVRADDGYLVAIGRGWPPKPGFFRLPPGQDTHEFEEHVEVADPEFSPVHPTIEEARAQALAGLVHYSDDKPKTSETTPIRLVLERYSLHHDHVMASRASTGLAGMPSLPASRQPSKDPRTSEAIRQQVLALHDPAAVREHEEFVARTMQVMGDALASMSTFRERHDGIVGRIAEANERLANPAKGTAAGLRRGLKQLEDEREAMRSARRAQVVAYRRSIQGPASPRLRPPGPIHGGGPSRHE